MSKVDILFLNNKAMEELGCGDMAAVMHDVERAYTLVEQGDVITPGKLPMRWGKTAEDENVYGRINAMPGYIGGEYNMPDELQEGPAPRQRYRHPERPRHQAARLRGRRY